MKTATLVSAISLALGAQAQAGSTWESAPQGQRIIPRLEGAAPKDGAQRKEIAYGPYTVPANGMKTFNKLNAESPCKNCYVTAMRATLKYAEGRVPGKEALTSEGAWLHHTVLASAGNGAIWAAGNERPTIRLNTRDKYGIDWTNGPLFFTLDVMSMKPEPMTVFMTINYEFIPKASASGAAYRPVSMRWNSIGSPRPVPGKKTFTSRPLRSGVNGKLLYAIGHMHDGGTNLLLRINGKVVCDSVMFYEGGNAAPGAAASAADKAAAPAASLGKSGIFSKFAGLGKGAAAAPKIAAAPVAAAPAPVAAAAAPAIADDGHAHAHRRVRRDGGHGAHNPDAPHISQPGACTNFGTIKAADSMTTDAIYDFNKYPTMEHNGKQEALMGNTRVYIGVDS